MTPECNLPEGAKAGAAILMDPNARSIAAAMRQLLSMTDQERETMGRSGRSLVEERFQWQRIGKAMTEVYDWILGHGPKPDFVLV
jgi:glycosyltransferase involved in cell wall biosynthesis